LLAVTIFIVFWVVLGLSVFLVAGSGPRNLRRGLRAPTHRGARALGLVMVVVYVAFGIALPLVFLSGNHANANAQIGGTKLSAAERRGRETFAFRCGFCHTRAGANTTGRVGPNLDDLKPSYNLILHTIQYGCLQSPPQGSPASCLGQGNMPANILQGNDAKDVAKFVASIAGKE
jgi:mono/diheme cytochrome c family protein